MCTPLCWCSVTSQKNGVSAQGFARVRSGSARMRRRGPGCTSFAGPWCARTANAARGYRGGRRELHRRSEQGQERWFDSVKVPVMIAVERTRVRAWAGSDSEVRREPRRRRAGRVRLRSRRTGLDDPYRRRAHLPQAERPWATPTTSTVTVYNSLDPHELLPGCAHGLLAAQTLDRRHAPPTCQRQAPALLPRRVQPSGSTAESPGPGDCCSTGSCNKPSPPTRTRSVS